MSRKSLEAVTFTINGNDAFNLLANIKMTSDYLILQGKEKLRATVVSKSYDHCTVVIGKTASRLKPITIDLKNFKMICKGRGKLTFVVAQDISVKEEGTNFSISGLPYGSYTGPDLEYKDKSEGIPIKSVNRFKGIASKISVKEAIVISATASKSYFYTMAGTMVSRYVEEIDTNKTVECAFVPDILSMISDDSEIKIGKTHLIIHTPKYSIKSAQLSEKANKYNTKKAEDLINTCSVEIVKLSNKDTQALTKMVKRFNSSVLNVSFADGKVLCSSTKNDTMTIQDAIELSGEVTAKKDLKLDTKSIVNILGIVTEGNTNSCTLYTNSFDSIVRFKSKHMDIITPVCR